ncbi:MAG TPA: hypothetical protein VFM92_06085 [Marivirga sp.]|nr:hypothetical protein [Marivirga sp.]
MKHFILFLFLFSILTSACNEVGNDSLKKCWVFSEISNGFHIYYPCGDERIQVSRFNPSYNFLDNNKCEYLVLSPNDAHFLTDGFYNFDPETSILTVESSDNELVAKLKIISLSSTEMRVRDLTNLNTMY